MADLPHSWWCGRDVSTVTVTVLGCRVELGMLGIGCVWAMGVACWDVVVELKGANVRMWLGYCCVGNPASGQPLLSWELLQ